jgi:hypothetical protein
MARLGAALMAGSSAMSRDVNGEEIGRDTLA